MATQKSINKERGYTESELALSLSEKLCRMGYEMGSYFDAFLLATESDDAWLDEDDCILLRGTMFAQNLIEELEESGYFRSVERKFSITGLF